MFAGRGAPILKTVGLHVDAVIRRPASAPTAANIKQHFTHDALIDTGASQCCIDISIAQRLQLVRTDQTELAGVGGTVDANVYSGILDIPQLRFHGEVDFYSPTEHPVPSLILLGRNFLANFIVVYDGPARCFYFYSAGMDPSEYHEEHDG